MCDHLYDVFVFLHVVGGLDESAVFDADLALALRYFVVADEGLKPDLF